MLERKDRYSTTMLTLLVRDFVGSELDMSANDILFHWYRLRRNEGLK